RAWAQGALSLIGTVPELSTGYSKGLLAVAVDPAFPARPFAYFWLNHAPTATQRVVRFTLSGALASASSASLSIGSPYVVLADVGDQRPLHNGGALRFGPDGLLYLSAGDDASCCDAQNVAIPRGKILRMDVSTLPAGAGGPPPRSALLPAAGNPFTGPND